MEERSLLIEKLKAIKENEYKVPEKENPFDLVIKMMNFIGDTDGYFRDTLIYSTLANWIIDGVFDSDELYQILNLSLDENHLFYKIGAKDDDSVFTRTFSALVIPLVLYVHKKSAFLSLEDLDMVKDKLICYIITEEDVRGYDRDKGWIHGMAHAADGLDELAKCSEINDEDLKTILQVIHKKMTINDYVYVNDEDERMVTAVISILERNIVAESEIISWIENFSNINKIGRYPEDGIVYLNTKNILRSLYFRLLRKEEYEKYVKAIKGVLDGISKF
ncbi:MAG: DUF2785 domain-containing protein [Halanaerobiales bacterium]|nr:DUF2785 domain-containing protein [Halanaerobiales bacterium]